MSEKVVVVKLSTGEEVIARLGEEKSEDTIILVKPRGVAMVPGPQPGQMGMTLVPLLASNPDADVAVYKSHIVATAVPTSELQKGYIENTTGLAIASSVPGQ